MSQTPTANRILLLALAAGLTVATIGFGLALVGGANATDAAAVKVTPDNSVRPEILDGSWKFPDAQPVS